MVGFAPLMVLNLPSGTGSPAPARPRSDRRGSVARRAPFHEVRRPFSAPTLESSLPGTSARVRACGGIRRVTDLSPEGDSLPSGPSGGASHRPLPDDRRVGCRRWSVIRSGRSRSSGNGRWCSGTRPTPVTSRVEPRPVVVGAGCRESAPFPAPRSGVGCTSRWVVVPRREFPSSLRSACAVSHDLGGLPLSGAVRRVSSGHAHGVLLRLESPAGGSVSGRPEGRPFAVSPVNSPVPPG
jgi:hypothetical protein